MAGSDISKRLEVQQDRIVAVMETVSGSETALILCPKVRELKQIVSGAS
jgi:hypothetical protein